MIVLIRSEKSRGESIPRCGTSAVVHNLEETVINTYTLAATKQVVVKPVNMLRARSIRSRTSKSTMLNALWSRNFIGLVTIRQFLLPLYFKLKNKLIYYNIKCFAILIISHFLDLEFDSLIF